MPIRPSRCNSRRQFWTSSSTSPPQQHLAEVAADVRKAELEHDTAIYQAGVQDRSNARSMAIATHDPTSRNLACIYTAGLFGVIAAHFYLVRAHVQVDPVSYGIVGNIEGVLAAMVRGSKEFFFGSSSVTVRQTAAITDFAVSPGTVTRDRKQRG